MATFEVLRSLKDVTFYFFETGKSDKTDASLANETNLTDSSDKGRNTVTVLPAKNSRISTLK